MPAPHPYRALVPPVCLALLLGCAESSSKQDSQAPDDAGRAVAADTVTPNEARFSVDEVRAQAHSMAAHMSFPAVRRVEIEDRLEKLLQSEDHRETLEHRGIGAVGAYRLGEGGAVVKVTHGDGVLAVRGSEDPRKFEFKSTSIGAVVGGSAEWGVVLFVGLTDPDAAPGKYRGSVTGATAVEESTGVSWFDHEDSGHTIYLVGTAAGLSANAGAGTLTLAYSEP